MNQDFFTLAQLNQGYQQNRDDISIKCLQVKQGHIFTTKFMSYIKLRIHYAFYLCFKV